MTLSILTLGGVEIWGNCDWLGFDCCYTPSHNTHRESENQIQTDTAAWCIHMLTPAICTKCTLVVEVNICSSNHTAWSMLRNCKGPSKTKGDIHRKQTACITPWFSQSVSKMLSWYFLGNYQRYVLWVCWCRNRYCLYPTCQSNYLGQLCKHLVWDLQTLHKYEQTTDVSIMFFLGIPPDTADYSVRSQIGCSQ